MSTRHRTKSFTAPFVTNPFWSITDEDCTAVVDTTVVDRAPSPQGNSTIPWLVTRRSTTTAQNASVPEGCATPSTKLYLATTYVVRLNTVAGLAPPAADCKQETLNTVQKVPYLAAYWLYVDPKAGGKLLVDLAAESIRP
ncbi:hypothetical protein HDU96_002595 [Phlyctochytrium bullatum]|nr:hypothetical protein HDU96_002595 [Phlyctochytrium bullatum]